MAGISTQDITTVVSSVAGIAGAAWAAVLLVKKKIAEARVDTAVSGATVATANAQTELYALLKDRLLVVEAKVKELELANAQKDEVIRQLRTHIEGLEDEMRTHGLNPPKLIVA